MRCGDVVLEKNKKTYVMGVVNVTPDSFSDGGAWNHTDAAIAHAIALLEEGADVLDVGGESTRPDAAPVSVSDEIKRVLPVVEGLVKRGIRNISVDTRNSLTARICLEAGASWINDVSGLRHDPRMADVVQSADAVVIMHSRGTPQTMQRDHSQYQNILDEVTTELASSLSIAQNKNIDFAKIIVDVGIGFGKLREHNEMLTVSMDKIMERLRLMGLPASMMLYGPSRKRFLGEITGVTDPAKRDAATLGACSVAAWLGVDLVRVHAVRAHVEALAVVDSLKRAALRS